MSRPLCAAWRVKVKVTDRVRVRVRYIDVRTRASRVRLGADCSGGPTGGMGRVAIRVTVMATGKAMDAVTGMPALTGMAMWVWVYLTTAALTVCST